MKIALINENSQAPKNKLIFDTLKDVAEPLGHTCVNYGRYSADDPHERTYVQAGILAGILLNSGAVDFVITGCGTGEGGLLACNAQPNVLCGYVVEPCDAYLFRQINNGNAISMPFAKGFGWGAELNLRNVFEKLLAKEPGGGYPPEWAAAEHNNKLVLDGVKTAACRDYLDALRAYDKKLVKGAVAEESFPEMFFPACKKPEIAEYVRSLL